MIILGAGMSGCLAGVMNSSAQIIEAKEEKEFLKAPEHRAVLRFRSDKISKITGIPFRRVQVRKSIWYDNKEHRLPDIRFTNMYSRKVSGGYSSRSIVNLDTVERWIPPEDFHSRLLKQCTGRVRYGLKVIGVTDKCVNYMPALKPLNREGSPILSTLAVPIMARILNLRPPVEFSKGSRINVARYRVKGCDLNLSMYYPSPETHVYRASVMGDLLSVEMIDDGENRVIESQMVLDSLGIDSSDVEMIDFGPQVGKINYSNWSDSDRKNWILSLTMKYRIYSLGRFAIWKNILQDDVYEDILKIREFLLSSTHYDMFKALHTDGLNA